MKFGLFAVLRAFQGIFLVTAITMFAVSVSFGGDKISVPPTVFEYGGDVFNKRGVRPVIWISLA